jgi:hypothetical protein
MGEGCCFCGDLWEEAVGVFGAVSGIDFLGFSPFLESEIGGWEGVGLAFRQVTAVLYHSPPRFNISRTFCVD